MAPSNGVARWRIAAGVAVLLALLIIGATLTPVYIHNLQLQSYVANLTQSASRQTSSDDTLRGLILAKANTLNLPVLADDVHFSHTGGLLHIDVHYFVTVNLPGYTVNLHLYSGAGSR